MKSKLSGLALALLAAAATLVAIRLWGEQAWVGQIACSICGPKRAAGEVGGRMTDRECTLGCVKLGARYSLVAAQKFYDLSDQTNPDLAKHAGDFVRITGRLKGNSIDVWKVELPAPPLSRAFPGAAAFSPLGGTPPHFVAYASDPKKNPAAAPIGFVFWTTDVVPEERGFEGPIAILVGMDRAGVLTGVVVDHDSEPYGYFSVEPPKFAAQFKGKSIRDAFRVGEDVDAVSRATMSVTSATRAIRDSARTMAKQLLPPDASTR